MRILLTGATGFIGKRLGVELARRGHELVVLVREPSAPSLPFPCTVFTWSTESSLGKIDAVIHLAGESIAGGRWTKKRKKKILESRTKTTEQLLALLQKQSAPKVFVSASAIGFYGDRGNEELNEESEPGKNNFLTDVCIAWEQSSIAAAKLLKARAVALRIGIVLGRQGGALQEMLPIFKRGFGGNLGMGEQWMSWIHVEDLVNLFVYAVEKDGMQGIYNAVAPTPIKNSTFTKELSRSIGRAAIFTVPKFVLQFALGEMSLLLLGSQKVSSAKAEGVGFRFQYPTLTDAFQELFSSVEKRFGALTHEFAADQWVPRKKEEIFSFFSDPKNLEKITPPWLKFRIVSSSDSSGKTGTVYQYKLRVHGIPFLWKTLILDWKENEAFVDLQEKGPYALWHHTHTFEDLGAGTLLRDRVRYRLPLGLMGELFASRKVEGDVKEIFRYRQKIIAEKFGKS